MKLGSRLSSATHRASDRPHGNSNRRWTLGCLSLYALAATGLFFLVFSPGPSFERDGPDIDFVERTVEMNAQTVHVRLAAGLENELGLHEDFANSRVLTFENNGFLTQSQIEPKADNNVALIRYARVGEAARTRDFFVTGPFKDWYSEYSNKGKRLPFNTNFFIHLEPIEEARTRIEVIEYFPRVGAGSTLRLCTRHGGPMLVRDVRPVAPTTRDRREMLDLVTRVVEREPPPR